MGSSVYIGVWINWSHGRLHGLTLTVDQSWSNVVVSSIALLMAFAATQIWGIVCFTVFRIRQSPIGNCTYHHIQGALRHSYNDPVLFAVRVVEILWSHFRSRHASYDADVRLMRDIELDDLQIAGGGRPTARHGHHERRSSFLPLFLLLTLAVAFAFGLTALSILSAQAFQAPDNTALIASPYCGWTIEAIPSDLAGSDYDDLRNGALLLVTAKAQYQTIRSYARSCYGEAGDGQVPGSERQCNTLVMPQIPSTLSMVQKCPFPGDGVCKTDTAVVESHVIDSRDTLGINTPDSDRVSVTKTMSCVPIDADPWASDWMDAEHLGGVVGDTLKGYAVGTFPGKQGYAVGIFPGKQGFQAEYPIAVTNYSTVMASESYTLFYSSSMPGNESETEFIPRDELKVADADLTLIALSSKAFFDEPISDPWFNISVPETTSSDEEIWRGPPGWSLLGCLEQYQLCASERCSKPSAVYQLQGLPNYGIGTLSPAQKAVADLVWKSLWAGQIRYALELVAGRILIANEMVMGATSMLSSKIPTNQWALEAWNLANVSLAMLQRRPSDYASPAPRLQEHPISIAQPDTEEARGLCGRIRIRTARYSSFRLVGLVLLVLATALAAVLNHIVPRIFSGRLRDDGGGVGIRDWSRYNFYHLIMAVCEGRDIEPWGRRDETVPMMADGGRRFAM